MLLNMLVFVWELFIPDTLIFVVVCPAVLAPPPSPCPCPENCQDASLAVGDSSELPEADEEEAWFALYGVNSLRDGAVLLSAIDVCKSNSPPGFAVLRLA